MQISADTSFSAARLDLLGVAFIGTTKTLFIQ